MAVLDPDHGRRRPVGAERALEVAAAAEDVAGAVDAVAVGAQARDRRLRAAVADRASFDLERRGSPRRSASSAARP